VTKISVLYDYQIFLLQQYGGISRYFKQITDCFINRDDIEVVLPLIRSKNAYFVDYCKQNVREKRKIDVFLNCLALYGAYIKHLILHNTIEILHPTYYYPSYLKIWPLTWRKRTKIVITVHDLICELFYPDIDPDINKRRKMINSADGIIAVSEKTKQDLLEVYPELDSNRIRVVYHGVDSYKFINKEVVDINKDYILFVGSRGLYKNGERYMHVLGRIAKTKENLLFVFVGGGAFNSQELELLEEEGIINRTIQLTVNDQKLYYLYSHAICFVFPSLYEGFGIPVLEAFSCGCPIVLSRSSCFPEIAKDAAVYFDGYSVDDMYDKILQVVESDSLRHELIDKGNQLVKEYTIEKTAEQTLDFYRYIVSNHI